MSTSKLNLIAIVAIVAAFAGSLLVAGSVFAQSNSTGAGASSSTGGNTSSASGGNATGSNATSSASTAGAGASGGSSGPGY